jgi:hypothetical protein
MSSSSTNIPSSPLLSEAIKAHPGLQQYLIRRAGQDILVTLEEARHWFQQGFAVHDPNTRQLVNIGAVTTPSYANGEGAFVKQYQEIERVEGELRESKKGSEKGSESRFACAFAFEVEGDLG